MKLSITGAACLYVIALVLGGSLVFASFVLPHAGTALVCGAAIVVAAIGGGLYSVRSSVKMLQHRD